MMLLTMPTVLGWVLGGNMSNVKVEDRPAYCRLTDKPRGFDAADFPMFMADDEALLRAAQADWVLAPMLTKQGVSTLVRTYSFSCLKIIVFWGKDPSNCQLSRRCDYPAGCTSGLGPGTHAQ